MHCRQTACCVATYALGKEGGKKKELIIGCMVKNNAYA